MITPAGLAGIVLSPAFQEPVCLPRIRLEAILRAGTEAPPNCSLLSTGGRDAR